MEPSKRQVISRSTAHTVRLIHLPHVQPEPVEAESNLERYFVHIAALYPFIRRITDQPFRLVLDQNKYTPDYLLEFVDDSKLVVEVKPKDRVAEYEQLFEKVALKLQEHGYEFLVAKDVDVKRDGIEDRALMIRRYCKTEYSIDSCNQAMQIVESHMDGIEIGALCNEHQIKYEVILYLIGNHQLYTDNNLSISSDARVRSIKQFNLEKNHAHQSHAVHFRSWFDTEGRSQFD